MAGVDELNCDAMSATEASPFCLLQLAKHNSKMSFDVDCGQRLDGDMPFLDAPRPTWRSSTTP